MKSFEHGYLYDTPISHDLLKSIRILGEFRGRQALFRGADQLHVVTIRGREHYAEGESFGIDDQMAFATGFATICRVWTRFRAPRGEGTDEESIDDRRQSIRPMLLASLSEASITFPQIPSSRHLLKRSQAVFPLKPHSLGIEYHGAPVFRTKITAPMILRFGTRGLPFDFAGLSGGRSGSTILQKRSGTQSSHLMLRCLLR